MWDGTFSEKDSKIARNFKNSNARLLKFSSAAYKWHKNAQITRNKTIRPGRIIDFYF